MKNVEIVYNSSYTMISHRAVDKFVRFCMKRLGIPRRTAISIEIVNTVIRNGIATDVHGCCEPGPGRIWISVRCEFSARQFLKTLAHELVHAAQFASGRLRYVTDELTDRQITVWEGKVAGRRIMKYDYGPDRKWSKKDSRNFRTKIPWEKEAFEGEKVLLDGFLRTLPKSKRRMK